MALYPEASGPSSDRAERGPVDPRLGTQLWLERDSSAEHVQALFEKAAAVGFGQVRLFLMWPWIQATSAEDWDFALFDAAFDAAAARGIRIKATLTANSGPWWLGTGSVLHSQTTTLDPASRPAMAAYIDACVGRYKRHPALGQWILWNEPMYPPRNPWGDDFATPELRDRWPGVLRDAYEGDLEALNRRWRTGYATFEEIPFADDVAHPAHRANTWRSFDPFFRDYELRCRTLEDELRWIADRVRLQDGETALCVNPCQSFYNHAEAGYDYARLARLVDVLGATFHAPWSFGFAPRHTHSALLVAGLTLLKGVRPGQRAEVTEVQTGNTHYAGHTPLGVSEARIAATHLLPVLAGAESVTGWCFNTRQQDFEVGEWGLLDDDDRIGARARAVTRAAECLERIDACEGAWSPTPPTALVLTSERSQAVEHAFSLVGSSTFHRGQDAAPQSAALLTAALRFQGVQAAMTPASAIDLDTGAELIVASHLSAWTTELASTLLDLAERGSTVVVDALTGQFDADARLHRPWPGGMADKVGARSRGLLTAFDGTARYAAALFGQTVGHYAGVRNDLEITDAHWQPAGEPRFAVDGSPVLWERPWGRGRLVFVAASLAKTVLDPSAGDGVVAAVLSHAAADILPRCRATTAHTALVTMSGDRGQFWAAFAPESPERGGVDLAFQLPPGRYVDHWSRTSHDIGSDQTLRLSAPEGIAVIAPDPGSAFPQPH
jgi:hypothetical protein